MRRRLTALIRVSLHLHVYGHPYSWLERVCRLHRRRRAAVRRGAEPVSEQEAAPRLGLAPAWLGSSRTPPDFRRRGRTRSSTERASNIWASRASGLRSSPPNPVDRGVLAADLRDRPPARLPRQGSHEERRSDRPARRTTRPDTPGLDTLSAACPHDGGLAARRTGRPPDASPPGGARARGHAGAATHRLARRLHRASAGHHGRDPPRARQARPGRPAARDSG